MAEELEVIRHQSHNPEEEGGGPVKTFLEHLEDLRWTLIKSAVAIFLGFIVCLGGAKQIIKFLTWPLERAEQVRTSEDSLVVVSLGTNLFHRSRAVDFPLAGLPTNTTSYLRIQPVKIEPGQLEGMPGGGFLLGMELDTNPPPAAARSMTVQLSILGPVEGFVLMMQIAIFGGITVSAPFVMFFIAQFVLPAMHVHEKKFLFRAAGIGSFLFLTGVAFCYLLVLVICLSTTVAFANWLGFSSEMWRADNYISFVCWFMLGTGVSFELPLVLLSLVKIGILDHVKLSNFRAYWVVVGLVLCGFVTPDGNPLTMLLLFLPLHALYEISVLIAWMWFRKEQAALKAGLE